MRGHRRKVAFGRLVALERLGIRNAQITALVELVEQEHHVGIFPGVRADAATPVREGHSAAFDPKRIDRVFCGRTAKVVRHVVVEEQRFLADH